MPHIQTESGETRLITIGLTGWGDHADLYPPWFDCTREHVDVLRDTRKRMGDIPTALEFRHQSWFTAGLREKTLAFMEREGWMHSVCDEPQAGAGSVPIVAHVTHPAMTMVRFHGRHTAGWNSGNDRTQHWRDVRYLYRYNEEELSEWVERLRVLEQGSEQVCVIFNNNSGGDAAANALQLMDMLGLPHPDLPEAPPEQLGLF